MVAHSKFFIILSHRSWNLEVILLYKADGHVLSIATAEGYFLSLFIDNKLPKLLLGDSEVSGPELKENESANLVHTDYYYSCTE